MELQNQIKKYRKELSMSQDDLAEKIFVSRQSISNWENGKTYPDLKSLLLLSEVFDVTLDNLVKGDIDFMKKEIDERERTEFNKNSIILTVMFLIMIVTAIPLIKFFDVWGWVIYGIIFTITMIYAVKIDKYKKKYDIQTYKEIDAFLNGKPLDEIEAEREKKKRKGQIFIKILAGAVVTLTVALLCEFIINLFNK